MDDDDIIAKMNLSTTETISCKRNEVREYMVLSWMAYNRLELKVFGMDRPGAPVKPS